MFLLDIIQYGAGNVFSGLSDWFIVGQTIRRYDGNINVILGNGEGLSLLNYRDIFGGDILLSDIGIYII